MTELYELFQKIYPLPPGFYNDLETMVTERDLPRKTILLKQGMICKEVSLMVKGLARAYYFRNDTDITSSFMRENELIISVNSFFRQNPSYENIELMEDSTLITIKYDHLAELYKRHPQFNFVTRVLTEQYYIKSEERAYSMRMKTARERYELMLSGDPQIFQRVPLKHIASYLGMKAETLSRIRSRMRYQVRY
jgi:CRP/FNR family transcriptional regulator, anaerobic regulatory protein